MRITAFISALCATLYCTAQDWCHPSSEWRYTTYTLVPGVYVMETRTSEGTTSHTKWIKQ